MVGVETSLLPYFRFFTSIFVVYTTTSFFSTALVHRLSSSAADNTDSSKLSVWAISAALSLAEMEFGDDPSKLSVWDIRAALAEEFGDDAATATSSSRNLSAEVCIRGFLFLFLLIYLFLRFQTNGIDSSSINHADRNRRYRERITDSSFLRIEAF